MVMRESAVRLRKADSHDFFLGVTEETPTVHSYFVDEAGDLTIFDRKGREIVGQTGVSNCFTVGAALIDDPDQLGRRLEDLRANLMADPYFVEIPSVASAAGKTARLFHAKDDAPEIRAAVFHLLRECAGVQIYAAFRRKRMVAGEAKDYFKRTGLKLRPETIYDDLVTSIFQNRIHLADENRIVFARRGKADRNVALTGAIELAKQRFDAKWRKGINRPTQISSSTPSETVGLQVVDYYLWALQRLLEKRESRYFNYLSTSFRLVVDRDDTRRSGYGEYYTASRNPLTAERLMPVS